MQINLRSGRGLIWLQKKDLQHQAEKLKEITWAYFDQKGSTPLPVMLRDAINDVLDELDEIEEEDE